MIPFEIEYIRPSTIQAAVAAHAEAAGGGAAVRYLSGGTEIVTMARDGKLKFDVLIDLKRIPETTAIDTKGLTLGSCLTLSTLTDELSEGGAGGAIRSAANGVADRTTRNSITLGGNICGMLPYRETLLPFLLFDGTAEIAGPDGVRNVPVAEIFDKRIRLGKGEFLLSLGLPSGASEAAVFYRRKTRDPRVDYPLVTLCMTRDQDGYRFAVSGATGSPIRSEEAEGALNGAIGKGGDPSGAAEQAAAVFDGAFRSDFRGGAEYRKALLVQSLTEGIEELGGTR